MSPLTCRAWARKPLDMGMSVGDGVIRLWSAIPSQAIASCRGARVGIIELSFFDEASIVSRASVG